MIDDVWVGTLIDDKLLLSYKNSNCMAIPLDSISNITEEILQNNFDGVLSDIDVMFAFKVLFKYMRNNENVSG